MKTLADLKRDLSIGKQVTLIKADHPNHKMLNIPRYVVKTQGNGVMLSPDKNATKGSFLDFPRASLLEYDGTTITIYEIGSREPSPQEQYILSQQPSRLEKNAKQCQIDVLTDGSTMFYADKEYFRGLGMEYLGGFEWKQGKKYDFSTNRIDDESIKGKVSLVYSLA